MSILETNKIDIVATRPDSPIVRLIIADHLEWDDFEDHARLIQAKVNTYLEFIESGQIARAPTVRLPPSPEVHIELILRWPPTDEAQAFLGQVRDFLATRGIAFELELKGPA